MKTVTSKNMQEIDRRAIEKYNIPSIVLMENAGIAVTDTAVTVIEKSSSKKVAIICGKGNNAGDGFVAARQLKTRGYDVTVFLMYKAKDLKEGDPLTNFKCLRPLGVHVIEAFDVKGIKKAKKRFDFDLIIDAVFGTGFSGQMPEHITHMINHINSEEIPVISVDVPSGLDATTGKVYDCAIRANKTVTMGLAKTGFVKNDGPNCVGELIVKNICFPLELLK
jgi:NAD(P)H-hydrate epimerase